MEMESHLKDAVRHFWLTRRRQSKKQGSASGTRDAGYRTAVTGGKQMDGFIELVRDLLMYEAGISDAQCIIGKHREIPGYFRSEKQWDLLVVADGNLLASIEFKSQVGPSFGNNYNNRTEEAVGSATDLSRRSISRIPATLVGLSDAARSSPEVNNSRFHPRAALLGL